MDKSYEKHTKDLFRGELMPFIAEKASLSKHSNAWLHWHENIEFLRCCQGNGEALSGGNRYSIDDGDIIVVNHGEPHYFSTSSDSGIAYRYMIIDNSFLTENGIDVNTLCFTPHIHDKKANELFDAAFSAITCESPFRTLSARTHTLNFLLYLCGCYRDPSSHSDVPSGVSEIKKVINHILNNFAEEISLQSAADIAGFSVCYFSRKFKKVTGQTFVTFLNAVRCEKAAELLSRGMGVTEVCYKCGFNDPSYFSRTFKSTMGYAPSAAKKKSNGGNSK